MTKINPIGNYYLKSNKNSKGQFDSINSMPFDQNSIQEKLEKEFKNKIKSEIMESVNEKINTDLGEVKENLKNKFDEVKTNFEKKITDTIDTQRTKINAKINLVNTEIGNFKENLTGVTDGFENFKKEIEQKYDHVKDEILDSIKSKIKIPNFG